tara:strand:- start:166271 stop:167230 length:960 start_codon:yes stop_codon:yes gene_type:complete
LSILLSSSVFALEIENKEDYLVKKGDTLWDISDHFLKDPWEWKKLWENNPQIENPHLIYPDDLIKLSFNEKGQPFIEIEKQVVKKAFNLNKEKVAIKQSDVNDSLPSVNIEKIKEFENDFLVLEEKEENILEGNLLNQKGDILLVYLENAKMGDKLTAIKKEKELKDNLFLYKKTGELKVIKKSGDLFMVEVTKMSEAINLKNIIIKEDKKEIAAFYPTLPVIEKTKIISTMDSINAYEGDVVLLNSGKNQGVELGNLFHASEEGKSYKINGKKVFSGNVKKATILVYRVENNYSFGVIVESKELIKENQRLEKPRIED